MFKDAEKGNEEINIKRTKEAIDTNAKIIAAGCPFCNTMLSDGLKNQKAEQKVKVLDIAEIVEQASID
jgi:heterodisulfide reductase subunit D